MKRMMAALLLSSLSSLLFKPQQPLGPRQFFSDCGNELTSEPDVVTKLLDRIEAL